MLCPTYFVDRECVRQDVGNTVKSVRNIMVRDGRGPCNRIAGERCQISVRSEASGATEFFTKKIVTNEKRSVHKSSGAVQQNPQSNVQRIFSSSSSDEPISTHTRQDLFSWLLPLCCRNTLTQAHPARSRLLRFIVFMLGYMLLSLLSLVNGASLNQGAVGLIALNRVVFLL